MSATPAQVANDLSAWSKHLVGRENDEADLCRDCARLIRALLAGEHVDGRTYGGVHGRLLRSGVAGRCETALGKSLLRGLVTITTLKAERMAE